MAAFSGIVPWILIVLFLLSPGYGALLAPVVGWVKLAGVLFAPGLWLFVCGCGVVALMWQRATTSGDDLGAAWLAVLGGIAAAIGLVLIIIAVLIGVVWR